MVQGRQRVPSGPREAKGTKWSKGGKGYQVVQGKQRDHCGAMYAKGTKWTMI